MKIKGKALHTGVEEGIYLERELSKQYLTGTLSPKEKYQIEDHLLEHDFSFEAMEGLEQIEWKQVEAHLIETEARIVSEFSLPQANLNHRLVLSLVGVLTSVLLVTWYFSSNPETVDMSPPELNTASSPVLENEVGEPIQETNIEPELSTTEPEQLDTINTSVKKEITPPPVTRKVSKSKNTPPTQAKSEESTIIHIAVGRVVDVKGIAIVNATVLSGRVSDTTDSYGYFALKVPKGGAKVTVSHLATDYQVEIDTNQNWEIVLDVAKRKVHDYSPMNAANRFK